MEKEKVLLSQEELGIYLSCLDGGLEYNLPFKVNLGKVKPDAINKAINEIFSSHPNLFSELEKEKDGTIYKEIVGCNISIPVYEKVKEEEFVRPFALLNSPLYHLVIEQNNNGTTLFGDFHHIVMDGTSIRIFLDELEDRLSGRIKGNEIEDVAFNQGEKEEVKREDDKIFSKCKDFYLSPYGNVDCESLPIIDKKEIEKSCGRIVKEIKVSRSKVDAFRKEHLIHTSSFFYGVYAKVIALYSNATDAFFLTVNNGRDEESKNSIGMFVKSYPIYTAVPDSGSIKNFLEMINLEQQENIKHSIYSFADFVSDKSIKPSSLFSYQGYNFYKDGKLEADLIDVKDAVSDFSVELFISRDLFEMHISYRKDLYEENTLTHFAELFENVANQFLVKENLEEVELMSKSEKDLLASFHETNLKEFDDGKSVIDLFKKVADTHPSSLCLVYHENKKTFKEVDEISNIIASNLISSGHKKEEVGAILLPRK